MAIHVKTQVALDLFLTLYTKNNVQKFIDMNIKAKTIQLLEANTGEYLSGLRVGK